MKDIVSGSKFSEVHGASVAIVFCCETLREATEGNRLRIYLYHNWTGKLYLKPGFTSTNQRNIKFCPYCGNPVEITYKEVSYPITYRELRGMSLRRSEYHITMSRTKVPAPFSDVDVPVW